MGTVGEHEKKEKQANNKAEDHLSGSGGWLCSSQTEIHGRLFSTDFLGHNLLLQPHLLTSMLSRRKTYLRDADGQVEPELEASLSVLIHQVPKKNRGGGI